MDNYFEIKPMSKEVIKINSIKNIYSVELKDIFTSSSSGIIARIYIVYKNKKGEIKYENFTSDQLEFDLLVKKIYSYIETNNIEIVSNIPKEMTFGIGGYQKKYTDDKVEMNENTKTIFYNNTIYDSVFKPTMLNKKPYYKEDNLFPIDYTKLFLPIVFQGLKELYNLESTNLQFDCDNITLSDTVNRSIVYCNVNNKRTSFILEPIIVNNTYYKCYIYSDSEKLLKDSFRPTEVEILLGHEKKIVEEKERIVERLDKIVIRLNLKAYNIHSESIYNINESSLDHQFSIYKGEDIIFTDERSYPKVTVDEKYSNFIENRESWFLLPWNAYIKKSIKRKAVEKGFNEKRIEKVEYFNTYEDVYGYYIFTEGRFLGYDKKTWDFFNYFFKSDSLITIGVPIYNEENIYEIETFYDNSLEKRYYMSLVKTDDGIKGISLENMIPVGITDGFISRVDFFKRNKVLEKMKGGNK